MDERTVDFELPNVLPATIHTKYRRGKKNSAIWVSYLKGKGGRSNPLLPRDCFGHASLAMTGKV
jgi:hypothetical protein